MAREHGTMGAAGAASMPRSRRKRMARAVKVTLVLPEGVSDVNRETAERKAREAAIVSLWEAGEISTREAAAALGLAYREFLDWLGEQGIPVESGVFDAAAVERAARELAARKV